MPGLMMEPGPTQVDPRVVQAMCQPAIYHLSPEFVQTMDDTSRMLQEIFETSGEVVILPSTGRGGLEAAVTSLREPGGCMVVVSNGVFGRMLATIGRSVGMDVEEVSCAPGTTPSLGEVERVVAERRPQILAVVHCETSTGMMNPMPPLGEIARRHGALFLVDAVASLGGAEVKVDEWGIDLCVGASQKALGAIAGVAAVSVSRRAREAMNARSSIARSNYFDLQRWWAMWLPKERGGTLRFGYRRLPWTMATHGVLALEMACRIVTEEETVDSRVSRHESAGRAFRAGLISMGFDIFPARGSEASTVTAFVTPVGVKANKLVSGLKERHGIFVAGGLEDLAGQIVRVGHMAETARPTTLLPTLAALAAELERAGIDPGNSFGRAFSSAWNEPAEVPLGG